MSQVKRMLEGKLYCCLVPDEKREQMQKNKEEFWTNSTPPLSATLKQGVRLQNNFLHTLAKTVLSTNRFFAITVATSVSATTFTQTTTA